MNNRVKTFAVTVVLSMVLAAGFIAQGSMQAVHAAQTLPVSEWSTQTYSDSEDLYLSTVVNGYVLTSDGSFVSRDASIKMVVTGQDLYFRLINRDGGDYYSPEAQKAEFVYALKGMGIEEITGTLVNEGESEKWYVAGEANIDGLSGMSNSMMMINELIQDGTIDLWFKCPSWNGEEDRILFFEISSAASQFASQYKAAMDKNWAEASSSGNASGNVGPAAQAQSNYYTDNEIKETCDNYVYCFNDVVPYANGLYESMLNMDEHPFLGFLGGAVSLGASAEPLNHFIEAKNAFDQLDTSRMTPDQRSYYYTTDQNINSTELGTVIQVIEFLAQSGLLS